MQTQGTLFKLGKQRVEKCLVCFKKEKKLKREFGNT